MPFDVTNTLESGEVNNGDINWFDGSGGAEDPVPQGSGTTTSGLWSWISGSTPSSGTGASSNPAGNGSYVYCEMSGSPAGFDYVGVWSTQYDNNAQDLYVEIDHWMYCLSGSKLSVEYATVASPGGGDWTEAGSITADGSDPGQWDTLQVDLSGIAKSSTVSIRMRFVSISNAYQNDGSFANWRIYGISPSTLAGVVRDSSLNAVADVRVVLLKHDGAAEASRIYSVVDHANTDGGGNYSFSRPDTDAQYCVMAINQGSPIVRGVTDDDLQPS